MSSCSTLAPAETAQDKRECRWSAPHAVPLSFLTATAILYSHNIAATYPSNLQSFCRNETCQKLLIGSLRPFRFIRDNDQLIVVKLIIQSLSQLIELLRRQATTHFGNHPIYHSLFHWCFLPLIYHITPPFPPLNRNLEAIARQLYDYWFVQFDFPDENGRSYKSSGGKMVWNEKLKREIPDGWEVVNLFDGVEVQYGFPFSTELFVEDETAIPVVRIRDILNGTTSAFSTEIADSKYKLAKGDLLIGMDGNFHMNLWSDDKAYLNQRSVRIRRKEDNQISALQVLFEIAPYIKAKEQNAKGSTVGHLSDKDLKGIWLLSPSSNTHFVPALTFGNIAAKLISNRNEIAALTAQRDELLPLLMNGQVSVRPRALNCDLSFMYRPVDSSCRMIRRPLFGWAAASGCGRYVANNA